MHADPHPRQLHHKTLSAYYSDPQILLHYLESASTGLIRDNDPTEYSSLLTSTICCPANGPYRPGSPSVDTHGNQQEVIDRILTELGKYQSGRQGRNVLLSGARVSQVSAIPCCLMADHLRSLTPNYPSMPIDLKSRINM